MGYRSERGQRRTSGQKFQKSQHEKAKSKARKNQDRGKHPPDYVSIAPETIVERTLNSLKRLGDQKFAVSPFSQYFDDWVVNLKRVLSEFESGHVAKVDEAYMNERQRILAKVENELAELKQKETCLDPAVRELANKNHRLVEIDAKYAARTRELGPKRNPEIQRLTLDVQSVEEELERVKGLKTSLFGFTKKARAKKEAEVRFKLESTKTELESSVQSFKVEEEKLHDQYQKEKQAVIERAQQLEKEVETLESDLSLMVRHEACAALIHRVNALLERQPASSSAPMS